MNPATTVPAAAPAAAPATAGAGSGPAAKVLARKAKLQEIFHDAEDEFLVLNQAAEMESVNGNSAHAHFLQDVLMNSQTKKVAAGGREPVHRQEEGAEAAAPPSMKALARILDQREVRREDCRAMEQVRTALLRRKR